MIKTLIYSSAFGKPIYFEMAQAMIDSLRSVGYLGDIAVITDREWDFLGAKAYPYSIEGATTPAFWKNNLPDVLEPEQYDKILFCDTDIAWNRHPETIFALDGIRIPLEPIKIKRHPINGEFLPEGHGEDFAVNAGTILMPGDKCRAFLKEWGETFHRTEFKALPIYDRWESMDLKSFALWDQGALQYLCTKKEIEWEPMPDGIVCFGWLDPYSFTKDSVAVHFCGPNPATHKKRILRWVKGIDVSETMQEVRDDATSFSGRIAAEKIERAIADLTVTLMDKFAAIEKEIEVLKREQLCTVS